MWRQLRVKNVFAKNTWNPNIYCGWNLKLTSSSIQSASVVYLLKQNDKCPVWRHLNSCISTQLLLGWQPKICFNYRGLDPHAVCHQTNCTLATLTHPRSLKNRRLENLVLCLNIPQKALLTEWQLLSVAQSQLKLVDLVLYLCETWAFRNASRKLLNVEIPVPSHLLSRRWWKVRWQPGLQGPTWVKKTSIFCNGKKTICSS